jgi:tRNA (guanine10-N2)-dimethyltransferase
MIQSVCILGRQPALGLAELESLYGAKALEPLSNAVLLDIDPYDIAFDRLGGTVKLAKLLTRLNTTEWSDILKYLSDTLPQHLHYIPEGKIRFGLSVYGLPVKPATLNRSGLSIKKVIKQNGRSVRIVPNTDPALSTAQVIHNQLTGPTGMELLLIRQGKQTLLAQTVKVQNIAAYGARDQKRPKRDAKVGMLPPKLAQIIINLAVDQIQKAENASDFELQSSDFSILDPFCGTGVILQEALLMGYAAYGTDIDERMIDYTRDNLEWLATRHTLDGQTYLLETGDATTFDWQSFNMVACETYLGRPFSAEPKPEALQEVIRDVDTIHKKFLQNLARQTKSGFRACIAVPAWRKSARMIREDAMQGAAEQRTEPYMKYGEGVAEAATLQRASSSGRVSGSARKQAATTDLFWHLKVLDSLEELGYTRLRFVHARTEDLIYHRPEQIVARELVVIKRK